MKKSTIKIIGVFLLLIGIIFIFSSFSNFTGNVVAEKIKGGIGSWIGLVFLVGGLGFFLAGRGSKEGGLEQIATLTGGKGAELLIDTNALKYMANLKEGFFEHYTVIIPRTVYEEARRLGRGRQPLIPQKVINNLTRNEIGAYIPKKGEYKQNPNNQNKILEYWTTETPQGKRREISEEKFKSSADMELLDRAIQRGEKPTIIFTDNFSEIGKIAEQLRKYDKINVTVLRPSDFFGKIIK